MHPERGTCDRCKRAIPDDVKLSDGKLEHQFTILRDGSVVCEPCIKAWEQKHQHELDAGSN